MDGFAWTRRQLLRAGALAAVGLWAGCRSAGADDAGSAPNDADTQALVAGLNGFAAAVYQQLQGQGPNVFFSPASLSPALAMTLGGARGRTATQMRATLQLELPEDRLHPVYGRFLRGLEADGDWQLAVANRLWGQGSYAFEQPFLELTRTAYGAELQAVDFAGDPEAARQTINAWVGERTRDLIPELFAPGIIDALTRLVLTNAIYFKGAWKERFDEASTRPAAFRLAGGGERPCRLMGQTATVPYAEVDGAQVVRLPYEGDRISFLAVLPQEGAQVAVSPATLTTWRARLRPQKVLVQLPKFDLAMTYELNDALKALGMPDAFDFDRADFSGVTRSDRLAITAVIHQAKLTVDEEGSEAAAATGVVLGKRSVERIPTFRADRPFLFAIQDDQTGAILFLGHLGDPQPK